MSKFEHFTSGNTLGDFATNGYAKIITIPLPLKNAENWADDLHAIVDVVWLSNYHQGRIGKYSICVRQDLKSIWFEKLDAVETSSITNGIGYVITDDSIDFYVRCGANTYPVNFNVTMTRGNIFMEVLDYEDFINIQTEGITLTYPTVVNENTHESKIYNYFKTENRGTFYPTATSTNQALYSYTATKNCILNLKLRIQFYSNSNNGNCVVLLSSPKEGELHRQDIQLSSTGSTFIKVNELITLARNETVSLYVQQWTGKDVNLQIESRHNI